MRKQIVKTMVRKCLGCRKGQTLLVVCDDISAALARDFYRKARSLGIEALLLQMAQRKMHGEEPPEEVAAALRQADAAILLTSMSLSHTGARKEACRRYGTRIASLPNVTEEILRRSILLDYDALQRKVSRVARLLTKGKKLEISTDKGTRLVMSIRGRKGFADDGLYTGKGDFGNLPAGEACVGPREGTTSGRLVVDGSAPFAGKLKRPAEIVIKKGYARSIPIPAIARLVKSLGTCAFNVAELGIGLNPRARVTGNILEDEKAIGTAHVALGDNRSFGGSVSCASHLDFVFFKPHIKIDGVTLYA